MKINRLAVIIIGEYRTWPIISDYTFNFFSKHANSVDYYFLTWNTTSSWNKGYRSPSNRYVTDDQIINSFRTLGNFKNQTLIRHEIINSIEETHTFYRMGHLSSIAAELKNNYENLNSFTYDQVVETRPDLFLKSYNLADWDICKNTEYWTMPHPLNGYTNDTYFRSSSAGYNIYSQRKNFKFPLNDTFAHHKIMHDFLSSTILTPIKTRNIDFEFDVVIRNEECANLNLNNLDLNQLVALNPRKV